MTRAPGVLNAEELGWIETAEQYAQAVVCGEIPAGKWVILACERYLADLERALAGRGRWKFQPPAAALVIRIMGFLENIKGPEAGQKLQLMPWQLWVVCALFGFKDRRTNLRRFRQASLWLPRGSGKSSLIAALALVVTFTENEGGAEGYAAAVTRDQARIVFDIAKAMVEKSRDFRRNFSVDTMRNSIFQEPTGSSLKAISSDAKALDGLNVHFAVCDEIGSHKSKAVYDVLATAMGKRIQPLLISISTTTDNVTGVGRQVWDYTTQVLQGVVKDDRFFGVIYAADDDDDVWQEATWIKANPSWGQTVQPDAIRAIAQQAMASPALQQAFKTRHLNLWGGVDNSLFDLAAWDTCCDPDLRLEAMAGRVCYGAIDMATRTDRRCVAVSRGSHRPGERYPGVRASVAAAGGDRCQTPSRLRTMGASRIDHRRRRRDHRLRSGRTMGDRCRRQVRRQVHRVRSLGAGAAVAAPAEQPRTAAGGIPADGHELLGADQASRRQDAQPAHLPYR